MNFQRNCEDFKNYNKSKVQQQPIPQNFELCSSFNAKNAITSKTKVIIVGTLTPPAGRKNGYFYSAPKNCVYKLLDNFFKIKNNNTNFVQYKENLINAINAQKGIYIKQIKNELKNNSIAFLDIIDTAIASTTSYKDDEIAIFNLDYNSFKNVLNRQQDIVFLCTSKKAVYGLHCILDQLCNVSSAINTNKYPQSLKYNNSINITIDLIPQNVRGGVIYNGNKIKNRQNHWNSVLDKYL